MDHLSEIEKKLAQLVPPALSEESQCSLDLTIDELSGVDSSVTSWGRFRFFKIAAVISLLAVPVVLFQWGGGAEGEDQTLGETLEPALDPAFDSAFDGTLAVAKVESIPQMELLKSTKRIDAQEDDGLIVPVNGAPPHYRYRYRVVDEEKVRDPQTGMVITLRQPRQEVVTIPVTCF